MKVFNGSKPAEGKLKNTVVTMGVFDGVHLGHQSLLKKCRTQARRLKKKAVVYTFDPHPVRILFPKACPPLLNTRSQKLELLKASGIDICIVEKFNKSFSNLTPESFFNKILVERCRAQEVIVGYDFTFGSERKGTTALLSELGQKHGIKVTIIDAFLTNGYLVSSTVIRQQIQDGNVDLAVLLLGRPYFIDGRIVKGDGLGRQMGFPTANLETDNELLPANGVYATRARLGNRRYNSVTNIGTRPTFHGSELRIETHLLNFNKKISHKEVRLEFVARLRPERPFNSPEELIGEINKDISRARRYFQGHSP